MPKDAALSVLPPRRTEATNRPTHRHTCRVSQDKDGNDVGHTWDCDSPYCEELERNCVDHGGEKPRRF